MNILECKNLRKEYVSGENRISAIDGISTAFEQGQFCAVTGQSGSGKSTFLHNLSSLEKPTSGDIIYNGKSLLGYNDNQLSVLRRRRFGFVFQSYNLIAELTAYENIVLPIMLDRKKPDEEYIKRIIEVLGISERLEHLPSTMSGGQQQRVAIARAIANKPTVLFADEPTGNLDVKSGREVMELLRQIIKEFNITLILVTHDMNVASQADRIITIEDGKIVSDTSEPAEKTENSGITSGKNAETLSTGEQ
ncbi:MAG: ABC transporter ATP-binding protein [Clostridiales bacterium]|nr:ABC transporter ATP-binding protein [Clostridiales bacterium]